MKIKSKIYAFKAYAAMGTIMTAICSLPDKTCVGLTDREFDKVVKATRTLCDCKLILAEDNANSDLLDDIEKWIEAGRKLMKASFDYFNDLDA